ncbi:MAG TPA: hypothetical protein VNZ52_03380 [Candidatus Thermoplasmatota archaeon]|nr:hypothetical protein [Candidatus Thermoplasmatota archaeon]
MHGSLPLLALAGLLLAAGAASAHATYYTTDDKYQIVLGNIGEPVYTDMKTGLDLIIRTNTTTPQPVSGLEKSLNATLVGPGGETLNLPLQGQHGKPGYYTFTKGYVLTQPGLYSLRLVGSINGTAVDGTYQNKHEIEPLAEIGFPAKGVSAAELAAKVQALEQKVAALEAGHDEHEDTARNTVPGFEALFGLAAVGAAGLLAFRRRN